MNTLFRPKAPISGTQSAILCHHPLVASSLRRSCVKKLVSRINPPIGLCSDPLLTHAPDKPTIHSTEHVWNEADRKKFEIFPSKSTTALVANSERVTTKSPWRRQTRLKSKRGRILNWLLLRSSYSTLRILSVTYVIHRQFLVTSWS